MTKIKFTMTSDMVESFLITQTKVIESDPNDILFMYKPVIRHRRK